MDEKLSPSWATFFLGLIIFWFFFTNYTSLILLFLLTGFCLLLPRFCAFTLAFLFFVLTCSTTHYLLMCIPTYCPWSNLSTNETRVRVVLSPQCAMRSEEPVIWVINILESYPIVGSLHQGIHKLHLGATIRSPYGTPTLVRCKSENRKGDHRNTINPL